MSGSSTISANPARQTVLARLSSLRLPSPAVTVALLIACVFLLRLPSALVPREFNVDESEMLSEAMRFLVDPRPWMAVDGGSIGPLNPYFIWVFLRMGLNPGFVLVHILASALVCLQVLTAYLTLRRLGSEKTAALGGFLMVLLYGLATLKDYLHYTSELLPSLLLMVGFYIFLVWLDEPAGHRAGAQLCILFSGGLVLGTAPWCKVQAVPITGALGLVVLAAIFRDRGPSFSFSWRVKELIAFCAGAVLTTCIMLAILAKTGAIQDFWYSYILGNLALAGSPGLTGMFLNFWLIVLVTPVHQLLLVAYLGVLVRESRSADIPLLFKKRKWAGTGLLVYVSAALFAVCRPTYSSPHHAIFLVPPMTYLAAVLASPEVADLTKSRRPLHRLIPGLVMVLLFATIGLYVAYGVRYAHMVEAIREFSHSQPDWNPRVPHAPEGPAKVKLKNVLAGFIGPRRWAVEDSNERIAEVVRDIQKTHLVRSLAILGWARGVYVLTGIPPATRESGETAIFYGQGPIEKYYSARYVGDLREKPPDLFIDSIAPDACPWAQLTENNAGYESDPRLRKFIEEGYILVDELTLIKGAKPIRFFARREAASQPQ